MNFPNFQKFKIWKYKIYYDNTTSCITWHLYSEGNFLNGKREIFNESEKSNKEVAVYAETS